MVQDGLLMQYLAEEALDQIEEITYRLLEEVGIELDLTQAQEMLHSLGCRSEGGRMLIPREVVSWALDNVTAYTESLDREGNLAFTLGDGQVRFHNGGGQPFALDLETGKERLATLQDVADATRLLDALPNVDQITPLFGPQDVPPALQMIEATGTMLRNTRKPIASAAVDKPDDVFYIVEMAAACCGGLEAFRQRPNMTISVSPVSPLRFNSDVTGAIMTVVQTGAPFHSLPAPLLGATAPITMAGALAQQHAEVLASFVIAAAVRPGAVVGYCSRISPVEMRTASTAWGAPEVGISGACAAQLAHRLGFPCDSYGLATSSTLLDPQFAYERMANALVPALAGVDILSGVGNGGGLVAGMEIAVIDDEIISLIKRIVGGFPVDETTLAYDVMAEVIPRDGVFMGEMHTVKQMRNGALWIPGISMRGGKGSGDIEERVVARARARAKQILATHEARPLPDEASRHLDEILIQARHDLVQVPARR